MKFRRRLTVEHVPFSLDKASSCKHLNITRAPSENPMRVTVLREFRNQVNFKKLTALDKKNIADGTTCSLAVPLEALRRAFSLPYLI